MTSPYRPLPAEALEICRAVNAPPRLVAHLTLVHDVACKLVKKVQTAFPNMKLDAQAIFFGAATHDIGKAIYQEELIAPGKLHELQGVDLMRKLGVPEQRARFAFSHGNWDDRSEMRIEDMLVALSDNCWKGKRPAELERITVNAIAKVMGRPDWEVFAVLDEILQDLAADADSRLVWQAQFPTESKTIG